MIELNEEQYDVVTTDEPYVVVSSSAGSGKTRCLVARYQYLVEQGVDPTKIVMITFTNAAAEEILERLGNAKGGFIGTVHSYANYLLRSGGEDTTEILDREEFDRLFEQIKANQECVRPVEYLLLDEGQDSTSQQFEFMLDIIKPKHWMIFADWRQSVYRWAKAHPDYIISLSKRRDVTVYELGCNYRCGTKILDFAKSIIRLCGLDYVDNSVPVSGRMGRVVEVEYSPQAIARSIAAYNAEYGSWFVLTRTNEQIDTICHALKAAGVPYDTFKRAQLDNRELNKKMKENTVKVLTIHTAKGLEADNVVVIGSKFYNIEEKCISYVAATRAKNLLVWTRTKNHMKNKLANWETR